MPENKCETCVECFKKHQNPRLTKKECNDYIERYVKTNKLTTYVFDSEATKH